MAVFIKIAVYAHRHVLIIIFLISEANNSKLKGRISVFVSAPHPPAAAQIFAVRALRACMKRHEALRIQPDVAPIPPSSSARFRTI